MLQATHSQDTGQTLKHCGMRNGGKFRNNALGIGMARIALIEDDPHIRSTLQIGLKAKRLDFSCFASAEEFLAAQDWGQFDLFLIDLGLPSMSGGQLCERIRQQDALKPIIVLTAMTQERTAVASFAKGADDFVRKPFGLDELYARIQRLLGRGVAQKKLARFEGLLLDRAAHTVQFCDQILPLATKEFTILALLIERAGDVVHRATLLNAVDDAGETNDRTLDSHISHLRKKLNTIGADRIRIASVYGQGYRMESA